MTLALLYIRIKQLQREIRSLGLYTPVLIVIVFYLIFVSFRKFENGQYALDIIAAAAFICTALQIYRKDKVFIYKQIEKPHLQLFSEYLALTLPFTVTALFTKSWMYYPLLPVFLFCISYLKISVRKKTVLKNLSNIIPASNFEWISGFRKSFIFFIGLYLFAVAFCWFRILPLFLLWFLTVIIISFYSECEPTQILRESGRSSKKFLLHKLISQNLFILILYVPLVIINTFLNNKLLLINLLFVPTQMSLLCFAICLKYSSYRPNKKLTENNILITIIAFLSSLPYLLPVPVILSFIYFYKAKKNLNHYLDD
jgi:hypothetical protein